MHASGLRGHQPSFPGTRMVAFQVAWCSSPQAHSASVSRCVDSAPAAMTSCALIVIMNSSRLSYTSRTPLLPPYQAPDCHRLRPSACQTPCLPERLIPLAWYPPPSGTVVLSSCPHHLQSTLFDHLEALWKLFGSKEWLAPLLQVRQGGLGSCMWRVAGSPQQ
jgi:hypothetical protein